MSFIRAILVGCSLLTLLVSPAQAQLSLTDLQQKLAGTWVATVADGGRPRVLIVDTVAQKPDGSYLVVGTYTFVGDRPSPFRDAQIQQSSGTVTLIFSTGSGSVYTLTTTSDGALTGTTKYKSGQVFSATMVKGSVPTTPVAGTASAQPSGAEQGNAFLSKSEVQQLVTGKEIHFTMYSNGRDFVYKLNADGNLYARWSGGNGSAEWSINDSGGICLKWRASAGNDGCANNLMRKGDKLVFANRRSGVPWADVEIK